MRRRRAAARDPGVGITAYGVLSRGLISGHWTRDRAGQPDFRSHLPRFSGENLDRNLALVEALRRVADAKGVTVAQLAIAWVLSRGADIVPLLGARRRDRLAEALAALDVTLTDSDLAEQVLAAPVRAGQGHGRRRSPGVGRVPWQRVSALPVQGGVARRGGRTVAGSGLRAAGRRGRLRRARPGAAAALAG